MPVVSINNQTVEANSTNNISSAVSVSDADEDTPKYKVKDTAGANSFYISGNAVDATGVNGYEFASSALSTLSVKVIAEGTQTLQIAAYDGTAWGDWTDFTVTTQELRAPTLSVNVPTLSVGKVQLGLALDLHIMTLMVMQQPNMKLRLILMVINSGYHRTRILLMEQELPAMR